MVYLNSIIRHSPHHHGISQSFQFLPKVDLGQMSIFSTTNSHGTLIWWDSVLHTIDWYSRIINFHCLNSFNQFFPACCQHVWQSGIMFSSLKCQQSFDRCQSPFSCWKPITDILPCLSHIYKNNSEEPGSCFIIFWANENKMIAILWYLQECCNNLFVSFVAHPLCFLLRLYKGVPMLELHLMAIIIFVTINLMNYLPSIIVDLKLKKYALT